MFLLPLLSETMTLTVCMPSFIGSTEASSEAQPVRLEFIGDLAAQYKVDGIVSENVRFCTYLGWDKFDLKKKMQERGIPILELDLEYGHPGGAQMKIRAEAFMEMLESRAGA